MGFIVKNTTSSSLLDLFFPPLCIGCGASGDVFCDCCKNDIILEHKNHCPNCKREISNGVCADCYLPPSFCIGWRDEIIGKLIHEYKYHSVRALSDVFADILDSILPNIVGKVCIVPLPTIQKHIRERGFDHTYKIAKKLAKKRGYNVKKMLVRANDSVQVGADRDYRLVQAAEAYTAPHATGSDCTYILFDDVWTTGASMKAAIKKLQQAGASRIILCLLAISRKPID